MKTVLRTCRTADRAIVLLNGVVPEIKLFSSVRWHLYGYIAGENDLLCFFC